MRRRRSPPIQRWIDGGQYEQTDVESTPGLNADSTCFGWKYGGWFTVDSTLFCCLGPVIINAQLSYNNIIHYYTITHNYSLYQLPYYYERAGPKVYSKSFKPLWLYHTI